MVAKVCSHERVVIVLRVGEVMTEVGFGVVTEYVQMSRGAVVAEVFA